MHTKLKGDIGQLIVALGLIAKDWHVAFPYGENHKYDLIVEKEGVFKRIQVKSVMPKNGVLHINCRSSNNWSVKPYSKNDFEILAAVNLKDNSVYYIPSDKIGRNLINLRLISPTNSQKKGIHLAEDFLTLS